MRKSKQLADLHFRLEQIDRAIAALEHVQQLRHFRRGHLLYIPPMPACNDLPPATVKQPVLAPPKLIPLRINAMASAI